MKQKLFYTATAIFFILSAILHYSGASATVQITICSAAVILLAAFLGRATENVAHYAGERMGGFLNATFGNAAELIIAIFLVKEGLFDMVKASITGSIIGNMLFVLGLSVFMGGLKFKIQKFNELLAGHNASLMLLAVIVLFIPAVFARDFEPRQVDALSLIVAGILIIAYILWLVFSMITHKNELSEIVPTNTVESHEQAHWSKGFSIVMLVVATVMVAFISEWLVGNLEEFTHRFGLSELFVGAFLIAIIGNAAEHSAAVFLAMKNKIGAAVEIAVGSSLQIALFVSPVLVFISFFFGDIMDIVFTTYELVAIGVAAFIAISISRDGKTNWYEGLLLIFVYIILGVAFFMA
ncbi:calcium/proton exchanger [Marinicrinis lubricantis]|uniref:Ca(2+)/H(+) antiporter n=1 Tax=Marinicrinis lubricantis TaxID=2086470 RepID=A0ABW1IMR4_9BACL